MIWYLKIDFRNYSSYYETFEVLVENGMLLKENLPLYKKMIGMRNKIVYDYERISNEVLYMVLQENLGDFDISVEDIKRNLKK